MEAEETGIEGPSEAKWDFALLFVARVVLTFVELEASKRIQVFSQHSQGIQVYRQNTLSSGNDNCRRPAPLCHEQTGLECEQSEVPLARHTLVGVFRQVQDL
jgi:hypothetical protein